MLWLTKLMGIKHLSVKVLKHLNIKAFKLCELWDKAFEHKSESANSYGDVCSADQKH